MRFRSLAFFAAISAALAFGLVQSSFAQQGVAGPKETVIVSMDDGTTNTTIGFDPILGWGSGEHTHDPLFQSTLLVTNDDITIGYDLATEYSISPDGLTWTFKIRDDVKFTDGVPLKASDVAFTYNSAMKQAIEADLSMIDRVEAPDAVTAVFHMKRPYSPFAYIAAVVGIVPEHAYDPATYGSNPIGSGKFVLKQWDKGEQVIMEANPGYYGRKPKIKRVVVVFMTEDASYAAALAGTLDVAYTEAPFTTKPVNGYKIVAFKSVDIRGVNLPVIKAGATRKSAAGQDLPAGNDATSHLAVRRAVNYAIDREAIVENVLLGYGTASYSECLGEPWDNPEMIITPDPAKSVEIMEADGWKKGSDGIYEKDGQKAEFDLLYIASNSARTGIAMAVAEMLEAVGIKANPVGSSWDQIAPKANATPHVFGAGMHSPSGVISHYYTGYNSASYSNKEVDGLIDQALAAPSVEASYPLFQKAQSKSVPHGVTPDGDSPWVWIAAVEHIYFARDGLNVVDNKIHPHGYGWTLTNNIDQWYWD